MKIAILDTYYPGFLDTHYRAQPGLGSASYVAQRDALMAQAFGTADFYSRHLRAAGHEVQDLVVNCAPLQMAWAREAGHRVSAWSMNIPPRLLRAPVVGPWLCALSGLIGIAVAQIRAQRPDVLYCQDLWFLPPAILADLKSSVGLIVGQTASPLPPAEYLKPYDLITTSFPHFVPRLRERGIAADFGTTCHFARPGLLHRTAAGGGETMATSRASSVVLAARRRATRAPHLQPLPGGGPKCA